MPREHYDQQLSRLDEKILEMGKVVTDTIGACIDALERQDVVEQQRLIDADAQIDTYRYEIERQVLVVIATQQPLATDLRSLVAILTIATELERIGDYCEGIGRLGLRMAGEPSVESFGEIRTMAEITQRLLQEVLESFRDRDVMKAGRVWWADDQVDDLYEAFFRQILLNMSSDPHVIRPGTFLLWIAHNIERMADRVTNIAERVAFIVTGDVAAFPTNLITQTIPD